jgi:hypothetical protein
MEHLFTCIILIGSAGGRKMMKHRSNERGSIVKKSKRKAFEMGLADIFEHDGSDIDGNPRDAKNKNKKRTKKSDEKNR